jgi:hypothetical protein
MARTYAQIPVSVWVTPQFTGLDDDSRLAFLYCWSGPHSTSAGIGRLPDSYASDDLRWSLDRWKGARENLQSLRWIDYDAEHQIVFVPRYLAANRPANDKHRAAVKSQIEATPCDRLRTAAREVLAEIDPKSAQLRPVPNQSEKAPLSPELAGAFKKLRTGLAL